MALQRGESRRRRCKATASVVEVSERIVKIDVEPFASCMLGMISGHIDQLGADALGSEVPCHHRVLNPCVHKAIPDHVHEPNKSSFVTSRNPSQTLLGEGGPPVPISRSSSPERLSMKAVDLCVLKIAMPLIPDGHRSSIVPSLEVRDTLALRNRRPSSRTALSGQSISEAAAMAPELVNSRRGRR
jgi:hypothetical protein